MCFSYVNEPFISEGAGPLQQSPHVALPRTDTGSGKGPFSMLVAATLMVGEMTVFIWLQFAITLLDIT